MSVGQIHVPEKRRIEAVRMAVRVSAKDATVEQIITNAEKFRSYYQSGEMPGNQQGASA